MSGPSMDRRGASAVRRWVFAAKPASWSKLMVPCVLGQAIGLGTHRGLSLVALGVGLAFTALDLLFIVFLNDWGDREVDAIKRRMYPRTSPKTIPDGVLSARQLLVAGVAAGLAALVVAAAAAIALDRPLLLPFALVALGLFVAYTLPPVRANYRGGGELLEMAGVGVVLPWMHAYLQGGEFVVHGLWLLPGYACFALASAIASGLSDERSDRRGGKTTFVTRFGNRVARRVTEALVFAGVAAWAAAPLPLWVRGPAAAVALFEGGRLIALSSAAVTDAFAAQRRYKARLHDAMWHGGLTAAMLLAWLDLR